MRSESGNRRSEDPLVQKVSAQRPALGRGEHVVVPAQRPTRLGGALAQVVPELGANRGWELHGPPGPALRRAVLGAPPTTVRASATSTVPARRSSRRTRRPQISLGRSPVAAAKRMRTPYGGRAARARIST